MGVLPATSPTMPPANQSGTDRPGSFNGAPFHIVPEIPTPTRTRPRPRRAEYGMNPSPPSTNSLDRPQATTQTPTCGSGGLSETRP